MPSPYTPEQVAFAAHAWTMRAEEERRSAAVFSDLLGLVADAETSLDIVRDVHGVVGDEIRHADLCARMASALGARAPVSRPLPRIGWRVATVEERRLAALEIVLVEGALGETISSALFAAGRRAAQEPLARDALARILRDEAIHAYRFWELLDALRLARDAEHLHDVASRALGAIEQLQMVPALRRLARGEPFDPAWGALGVLAPEARVDAFYGAVERRIVPSLNARGIGGDSAWANRYHLAPTRSKTTLTVSNMIERSKSTE
jgi:hypothetical protein